MEGVERECTLSQHKGRTNNSGGGVLEGAFAGRSQ